MKKTLSIILIMTLLSSLMLLMLPTSAAEPTITEAEAKQLLVDAYNFVYIYHWQSSNLTIGPIDNDGLTELKNNVKKTFDSSLVSKMIEYTFDGEPFILTREDGKFYFKAEKWVGAQIFSVISVQYPAMPGQSPLTADMLYIDNLEGNSKNAEANFVVEITDLWVPDIDWRTMTVEYKKTADGWRISGGEFIDVVCGPDALENVKSKLPYYTGEFLTDEMAKQLFADSYNLLYNLTWQASFVSESKPFSEGSRYYETTEALLPGGSLAGIQEKFDAIFEYTEMKDYCIKSGEKLYWLKQSFPDGASVPFYVNYHNSERLPGEIKADDIEITYLENRHSYTSVRFAVRAVGSEQWREMTVTFSNNVDGWRMCYYPKYEYFDCILSPDQLNKLPIYVPQSPSTGDETPIYIAVCAVSALTVIACGTSVARKRRRED